MSHRSPRCMHLVLCSGLLQAVFLGGCSRSPDSTIQWNRHSIQLDVCHADALHEASPKSVPVVLSNLTSTSWPSGVYPSLEVAWQRSPEISFHEVWVGLDSEDPNEQRLQGYVHGNTEYLRTSILNTNELVLTINLRDIPSSLRDKIRRVTLVLRYDYLLESMNTQIEGTRYFVRGDELSADLAKALNARAWFLATYPIEEARDGRQALADALESCRHSEWKTADFIDTLAAAYAESGDYEQAIQTQQRAIAQVTSTDTLRTHSFGSRLAIYQRHQRYQEWPPLP